MRKKIIIIGAGLAGLSAGIYLQREGIDTQIFELSPRAGGMCAAWSRKGYRFDGCIHWMVGTRKGEPIYNLYKEVGALTDDTRIYSADFERLEIKGTVYDMPMEPAKFKAFLLSLSENDAARIEAFCGDIEMLRRTKLRFGPPERISEVLDAVKNSRGFFWLTCKYQGRTVGEFASSFKSDIIRDILTTLMPGHFSAAALLLMLGTRMGGNAGYPHGGASEVVRRMAEHYSSLGGQLNLSSAVSEILVADGRVRGVRSNGTSHRSDGVIAACDAFFTLRRLLGGRYSHPQLDSLLDSAPLFDPLAVVSFGLARRFDIPYSVTCECPEGFETAPGVRQYGYHLRSFDFEPAAAPKDGSSVMVTFSTPLDYWMKLRHDHPDAYRLRKEYLAETVASKLEARYPGFKDAVDAVDVATPATFVRMTYAYKGSFEGFAPTPTALKTKIRKTLPGLKGFCLCGQWTTAGGGICAAVADGKEASKIIKRQIR